MTLIVGIHDGYDRSTALMVDDQIAAPVHEARFCGEKVDCSYPEKVIESCRRLTSGPLAHAPLN